MVTVHGVAVVVHRKVAEGNLRLGRLAPVSSLDGAVVHERSLDRRFGPHELIVLTDHEMSGFSVETLSISKLASWLVWVFTDRSKHIKN